MKQPNLNDPIRLPLLITGIAGVVGYNAFHHFRGLYGSQVMGQRPVNNWPLRGDGIVACDLDNAESVKRLFDQYRFQSVLSCGGCCALKSCELDPSMARRANVTGLSRLLDALVPYRPRLIHLSIDLVYSGVGEGNYTESDLTDPVTVYGKTMVEGESLVRELNRDACILRISLPMGVSFNGHAGAVDWIQARFAKNKPATLYFDEVRTPTYVGCLHRVFSHLFENPAISGTFHAGGPRCLSLYQIAQIVNRVGGYDPGLLQGCERIKAGPIPPRAGNVTMNSSLLAETLGYSPFEAWPLREQLVPTDRQWHYRRGPEAGSRSLLQAELYEKPLELVKSSPNRGPISNTK